MKISRSKAKTAGSVLVITVVIVLIIGATVASYLTLVSNQSKAVARSQIWNSALAISEAGIEDGMQLLNKFVGTPNLGGWASTYWIDGWTRPGAGNLYMLTRYTDAAHTTGYRVYLTNLSGLAIVHSVSFVPGPAWIPGRPPLSRTVEVRTQIDALFNVCMAALGAIDLKGNNVASDSFDSKDPNYSTNGLYTPLRRKANGDIVTNNTITNSVLSIGNADIAGHVTTGPNGSITIGANGSVGDIAWVTTQNGIKPGWSSDDLNVVFKPVVMPNVVWNSTGGIGTGGGGTAPDGKSYNHIFTSTFDTPTTPGNYTITDSGDIYVGTNVAVRLNVTASTYNPNKIYVAGMATNEVGKLIVYLNGPPGQSATLGTDDKTQSGRAENLLFFGTPNFNSLSYKGNGDFTGAIYCPAADFQLAGGGSGFVDFIGSSVTKTVQMNGHYHFHYDEDLKKVGPNNGYVATAWKEF